MRHNSIFLAVAVCLFASVANAATISRLTPDTINFGNVEEFLTIYGTDLAGSESVVLTIDGPAGAFVLEPSNVEQGSIISWIPEMVLLQEGTYAVSVAVKNIGEPVQNLGPLSFSVRQSEVFGPPVLNVPEYLFADAADSNGARVNFEVSAVSQNGADAAATCDRQPGDLFPFGSTLVSCSANDEFGTSYATFEIFVGDFTAPVLTLPADFSSPTPVVEFTVSAVDNIDGPLPVTCSRASGSLFPSGVVEVVCSAFDSHFNPAVAAFYVTVAGGAPVLNVPADIVAEATGSAGTVVSYVVTATEDGVVACTPGSGSTFPLGTTAVVCTATNGSGSTSGGFNVTVVDTRAPVLSLPSSITAEASGPDGAAVTYTATASDVVEGSVAVTCAPVSGSTFAAGTTLVSCTSADSAGNTATGSFAVTVLDTTPPQITSATVSPDLLWPPNHQMVPVTVTVVATDLVDPAPIVRIVSIASNQPVNGTGDGDMGPDWTVTSALTANLRAERAGSAERIYTITIEASDAAGNSVLREVTVRVAQTSKRRSAR
ncbi:MAG TPA: HYR domain-containing protein [Thermoanaerobaculia bacterium]